LKTLSKRQRTLLLLSFCISLLFLCLWGSIAGRDQRERAYLIPVCDAAREFNVPASLVLAVIRSESDFRKNAHSDAGAVGLMQLMPQTFNYLAEEKLQEPQKPKQIWEPVTNIRYGTYYLSYLYERFGNWETVLAAYNAGEGRVAEWLEDPKISENGILLHIPFQETDAYVAQTLKHQQTYVKKYRLKEQ
jgi:soluble lytic murein transglycosylase